MGDSRAWLLDRTVFRQVTVDHTITQQLVNWGDITNEEALIHPDRHKLTQALGLGDRPPAVTMEKRHLRRRHHLFVGDGWAGLLG